jgi:hypothetical protein
VADAATLEAIAAELGRDRTGAALERTAPSRRARRHWASRCASSATQRQPVLQLGGGGASTLPGSTGGAGLLNARGRGRRLGGPCVTRTLSHVVYFVPDSRRGPTAFYRDRLGFRRAPTASLGAGPFLRPAGTPEHHTLFLIQTPPFT